MLKKFRLKSITIVVSVLLFFFSCQNVIAHGFRLQNNNEIQQQTATSDQLLAQQDFDQVEVQTIPVRDNIYMLATENSGNIGITAGDDGVLMIDSQFSPLTAKITTAISKISKQPIRFLINTHYHFDHTNGNANIKALGATLIAHDNVPKQMSKPHSYKTLGMDIPASDQDALPIITFSESADFSLNNHKIHTFHIPLAHTDGDVVIQFLDQNVIHTGDLYFNGVYPFIDVEVGGSINGMIAAVNEILALCDQNTLIIPGHGNLSNREELIVFRNMLNKVSSRVKTAIDAGTSLEDLLKAKPLADLDATWGQGFLNSDQFLTIVYEGFKNKNS